jgi:hypothetical protein
MMRAYTLFLLLFANLSCNELFAVTQATRNTQSDSLSKYSGVTWIPGRTLPGIIREKSEESPEAIAASFINSHLNQLRVSNAGQVQYVKTIKSLTDKHVIYQQVCQDVPVYNSYINICINGSNEIYGVMTNIHENVNISTAHSMSAEDAIALVLREYDEELSRMSSTGNIMKFVVYNADTIPTVCWMVEYYSAKDHIGRRVFVDATTGRIQAVEYTGTHSAGGGTAKVFNPDPITKERNNNLLTASTLQPDTYIDVTLEDLDGPGEDGRYRIRGKYAISWEYTYHEPAPAHEPTPDFDYDKSQPGFQEANIYYHIDTFRRYIDDLGFEPTFGYPASDAIKYDAHAYGTNEAAYFSHNIEPYILFGDGGNASGEDQDVIIHEYTHAVHDALMDGISFIGDQRGISEGSADYIAVSYRNTLESSGIYQPGRVFPWNQSDEYTDQQNPPRYVYDYNEEIANSQDHEDYSNWQGFVDYKRGTIWARALMDLQKDSEYGVGRDIVSSLLLKSFSLALPTAYAPSHVLQLMRASRDHFDSKQLASLGFVFERRGFFKDRWTNAEPPEFVHASHYLNGTQAQSTSWDDMYWLDDDFTLSSNQNFALNWNGFFYVGSGKQLIIEPGVNFEVLGRVIVYENASIVIKNGATLNIAKFGSTAGAIILRGGSIICEGSGQVVIEDSRGIRGSGTISNANITSMSGLDIREDQALIFQNGGVCNFDCTQANRPQYILNNGNVTFEGSANEYVFGSCLDEIRIHSSGSFVTEAGVTLQNLPTLISWDYAVLQSNGSQQDPCAWLFRSGAGLEDYSSLLATRTTFGGSTLSGIPPEEWEGILVGDVSSWIDLDYCTVQDVYADLANSGTGIHFYQSGVQYISRIRNSRILRNKSGQSKYGDGIFLQPGNTFSYVKLECSEINQDWYTGFTSVGSYPRVFDSKIMSNLVGVGLSASSILTMQRSCVEDHVYEGIDVNASELSFASHGTTGGNRIVDNANQQLDVHNGSVVYGGWDPAGGSNFEGHDNNISSTTPAWVANVNGSTAYLQNNWFGVVPDVLDPPANCTITPTQAAMLFNGATIIYNPAYCSELLPSCSTECLEFFQNPGGVASFSNPVSLPPFASGLPQLRAYARVGNFAEVYRFMGTMLPNNVSGPVAKRYASFLMHLENEHVRNNPDTLAVSRSRLNAFLLTRFSSSQQFEAKAAILNVLARSLFALEDIPGADYRISQLRNQYPNSPYALDILPVLQLVAMAQRDSVKMNNAISLMQLANFPSEEMRLARTMKRAYHRFRPQSPYPKSVFYTEEHEAIPQTAALEVKNYPNPFNPSTVLEYALPESGHTTLLVYDLLGRAIATLVDEEQVAGVHSAVFDAGNSPSGIYMYVLTTASGQVTGKMLLAR